MMYVHLPQNFHAHNAKCAYGGSKPDALYCALHCWNGLYSLVTDDNRVVMVTKHPNNFKEIYQSWKAEPF